MNIFKSALIYNTSGKLNTFFIDPLVSVTDLSQVLQLVEWSQLKIKGFISQAFVKDERNCFIYFRTYSDLEYPISIK